MRTLFPLIMTLTSLFTFAQERITATEIPQGGSLLLTEELRFGAVEDEDHYFWPSLRTKILPAPNDQIYIVDAENSQVLLFDRDGKFVKQVARAGQGPGELQYITAVSQAANGSIYIIDMPSPGNPPSIKIFNADMSYRNKIATNDISLRPEILHVSPDERYLGGLFVTFDRKTKALKMNTGLLRLADKKVIQTFSDGLTPLNSSRITDQNEWVKVLAKGFRDKNSAALMTMGRDGSIYTSSMDKYLITVRDPEQETALREITRKYKVKTFTEADRAALIEQQYENLDEQTRKAISKNSAVRALEKAGIVAHPPMLGVIDVENHGFLVVREADASTRVNKADLFSKEGKFLAEITMADAALCIRTPNSWLPLKKMVFHKGKAYSIITTEEGDQVAVRYSYQIKKS